MPNNVIIAGAGIGGLAIAHGLKKHGIPFHIYERDSGKDYRAQGYRIRVARDAVNSLQWLFDNTTWQEFELTCGETRLVKIAEIDAGTAEVNDPDIELSGSVPSGVKPYTVDRTMFREVMLRGLGMHISWAKEVERYEEAEASITVHFADGSLVEGALLIGADGAHSKVRQQYIPNHQILPTGGFCIYGKTELTQDFIENVEPAVLRGMSALKDRTLPQYTVTVMEPVVFQRRDEMRKAGFTCPQDYLYWVLSGSKQALGLQDGFRKTPEQSAAIAEHIARTWHPAVKGILTQQLPGSTSLIPINSVPRDFGNIGWQSGSRVTLIGDAVHIMGPTSGSGAIVALRDAATLCKLLVENNLRDVKSIIEEYEMDMRDYATYTVNLSWDNAPHIFGQSAGNDENVGETMMRSRQRKH
jgi:2-polyprenyl-6-methoxyphenol hydroxylase-like FAD-dependent oxidoreductase